MSKPLAMIFPGQGSQFKGMLAELMATYPIVQQTFTEASDALQFDMTALTQTDPDNLLDQTAYTQPALLACSVAIWRIWYAKSKVLPQVLAGHSLGEYSALVCAQAIDFADALKVVHQRGLFMQAAVSTGVGAMAAIIGLEPQQVSEACETAAQGEVVAPANFNAIGQIVISGTAPAVARAMEQAKTLGAKLVKLLPVSVPSHCLLMADAARQLEQYLNNISIKAPNIPVLQNVTVTASQDPGEIRRFLVEQLYSPVRWIETVETIYQQGIDIALECGAGKVLAGLNKRIEKNMNTLALDTPEAIDVALKEIM